MAKRKEGITVEEIPPVAPEDPPPPPPADPPPDTPEDASATPTVIAGLSITPHTTYRTQLVHTRPESGVPVFGMPTTTEAQQEGQVRKKKSRGRKETTQVQPMHVRVCVCPRFSDAQNISRVGNPTCPPKQGTPRPDQHRHAGPTP